MLVPGRNAPFRDCAGIAAHAKSAEKALVYGSPGQGRTQHPPMAQLLNALNVKALHVPYQGAGPMAQAALGGQIMVFIESPTIPTDNNLPVLAVFSRERLASFPRAPTLAELGVPIAGASQGGLVTPDRLPDAIAAKLEAACETGVTSESCRTAATRLAAVARFMPGAQFRDRFIAESAANKGAIAALGLARE